ncbi:transmembrane protein 254-like isoform X3 [Garra rufa]|uniref:transmembrane protein 254-like isoform X3 n=1 Tax=Garra rufa TaxID=137080 RepID=UPI003CCE74D6
MAKRDIKSYFRRTSLLWMVVVTVYVLFFTQLYQCFCSHCGFIGFQWMVFWPQDVPYGSLGPLGALAKHFVDYHYALLYYGWFLLWVIHLFEALFAMKICR